VGAHDENPKFLDDIWFEFSIQPKFNNSSKLGESPLKSLSTPGRT